MTCRVLLFAHYPHIPAFHHCIRGEAHYLLSGGSINDEAKAKKKKKGCSTGDEYQRVAAKLLDDGRFDRDLFIRRDHVEGLVLTFIRKRYTSVERFSRI